MSLLLSAALILVGGYVASKLAERIRMATLLGMTVFGILEIIQAIAVMPILVMALSTILIEFTYRNRLNLTASTKLAPPSADI